MVERQPEKLKVVGSSPIPNIMFFFILCIFIIIFNSSISVNVYFNMIYICLSIYSITYLFVFIFKFGKLYLSNFNFAFNLGSLITKFSLFFSVLGRYRARFLIIFKSYTYSLK